MTDNSDERRIMSTNNPVLADYVTYGHTLRPYQSTYYAAGTTIGRYWPASEMAKL